MAIGTVKFFNTDRGYGFITNEAGGPGAFVHVTAVEAAGPVMISSRCESPTRKKWKRPL